MEGALNSLVYHFIDQGLERGHLRERTDVRIVGRRLHFFYPCKELSIELDSVHLYPPCAHFAMEVLKKKKMFNSRLLKEGELELSELSGNAEVPHFLQLARECLPE